MDLHMTRGLEVTRLIGAVAAPDRGPRGLLARRNSGFVTGAGAVELGAIERGHAVGVCLDVSGPLQQSHVFLQVPHHSPCPGATVFIAGFAVASSSERAHLCGCVVHFAHRLKPSYRR